MYTICRHLTHLDGDTAEPGEAATEDAEGVTEDTRVVARLVVGGAVGGAVDTELVSTRTLLSSPRRRLVYSVKSSSL